MRLILCTLSIVLLNACYVSVPSSGSPPFDSSPSDNTDDGGLIDLVDGEVPLPPEPSAPPRMPAPAPSSPVDDAGTAPAVPPMTSDASVAMPDDDDAAAPADGSPSTDPVPMMDAGPRRPALRFDSTSFIQILDSPELDTSTNTTFEMWVRPRSSADGDFCGKGLDMARHMIVGHRGGQLYGGWQVERMERFVYGPALPLNRWSHVALVYENLSSERARLALVVNGILVTERTDLINDRNAAFNDVALECGSSFIDLDELRYFHATREPATILSQMSTPLTSRVSGLSGYWKFDESGQLLVDSSSARLFGILGGLNRPDAADPERIFDGAI